MLNVFFIGGFLVCYLFYLSSHFEYCLYCHLISQYFYSVFLLFSMVFYYTLISFRLEETCCGTSIKQTINYQNSSSYKLLINFISLCMNTQLNIISSRVSHHTLMFQLSLLFVAIYLPDSSFSKLELLRFFFSVSSPPTY